MEGVGLWPYHAAHEGDDFIGAVLLERCQSAKPAGHLALGPLTNHAAIENDDVGILEHGGHDAAQLLKSGGHALGVCHVHLAANGPDVVGGHRDLIH